jgi:hypothetical protein
MCEGFRDTWKGTFISSCNWRLVMNHMAKNVDSPSDFIFYICGSVHHQSISLNNQRYAVLSSRIYSSLQGYSTYFGCFLHPSSGVQLKLQMQS